jgi:hypothetical protein
MKLSRWSELRGRGEKLKNKEKKPKWWGRKKKIKRGFSLNGN